MKLLRIRKCRWDVLAVLDEREACQVLDFLQQCNTHVSSRMLSHLREYVPEHGPQTSNENVSKHLTDHILEFKKGPKRGKKMRVLYFFDEGKVVVCTEAFTKGERTPQNAIERATRLHAQYLDDKKRNQIEIIDIPAENDHG